MPAPKPLTAKLQALADALAKSLDSRTTKELSEAGAETLSRVSPEDRVAIDEALEKGAKLGEVEGDGLGERLPPYMPNAYTPAERQDLRFGLPGQASEIPVRPYGPPTWAPDRMLRREAAMDSMIDNADLNVERDPRTAVDFNDPVGFWPDSWLKAENIPAVAGVAGAGAMLASGRADAADDWTRELQPDPRDPNAPGVNPDLPSTDDRARIKRMQERIKQTQQPKGDDKFFQPQTAGMNPASHVPELATGAAPDPALDGFEEDPAMDGFTEDPALDGFVEDGAPQQTIAAPPVEPVIPSKTFAPQGLAQREVKPFTGLLGQMDPSYLEGVKRRAAEVLDAPLGTAVQGLKTIFAPAQYIKDEYLAPLVKQVQAFNRGMYFGRGGHQLRTDAPQLAFAVENLGKVALGPTDLNAPGSEHPAVTQSINTLEQTFGRDTAAFVQAFEQGLGNLPFYLIPGVGQSAALQGATGGFLSSMVDPESESVMADTLFGAAGGKLLEEGAKLGGKLLKPVKDLLAKDIAPDVAKWGARPEILPVAVVPPEAETQLAEAIFKLPDEAAVVAPPPAPEPPQHVIPKNKWGAPENLPEDPGMFLNPAGAHAGLAAPSTPAEAAASALNPAKLPAPAKPKPVQLKLTKYGEDAFKGTAAGREVEVVGYKADDDYGSGKRWMYHIDGKPADDVFDTKADAIKALREKLGSEPKPAPSPTTSVEQKTGAASPRAGVRAAKRPEPVVVAVDVNAAGEIEKAALVVGNDGKPKKTKAPKNFDGKHVLTPRARDVLKDNPGNPAFEEIIQNPKKVGNFALSREELLLDQALPGDPPVYEGSVLVLEGMGGDGTARLYDVNDPKLQVKILERRDLSEVVLDDGRKLLGYPTFSSNSDMVNVLPPEGAERIPGALTEGVTIPADQLDKRVRSLSTNELKQLVDRRLALLEDEAEQALLKAGQGEAAQADIALGGDGSGNKLPPNPPHPPPAPLPQPPPPPGQHHVIQPTYKGVLMPQSIPPLEELKLKWWQQLGQRVKDLRQKLVAPTNYGPIEVADNAMQAFSVQTLERLRDDVFTALVKSTPKLAKLSRAEQKLVHQDIVRLLTGELTEEQFLKSKHFPLVAEQVFTAVNKYKERIAENEKVLRELNMLGAEENLRKRLDLEDDDDLPGWAVQMYYRFLLKPGEWSRLIRRDKQKTDRVMRGIMDDVINNPENKKKYGTLSDEAKWAKAREYFDVLVGDPTALKNLHRSKQGAGSFLAEANKSLLSRKDLKDWEREALGFVNNSFTRIAESITRQEQLILQGKMWKSVADNPVLSTYGDMPDVAQELGHTKQLPRDPSRFGLAAGKYVSPDTFYALVEAPRAQRVASTLVTKFNNAVKYGQTVANPGSWIINFFANAQGVMLSNLVNPITSPGEIGHGMARFAMDYKAHITNPGLRSSPEQQRFMRAVELGVVGSDYATAEFRKSAFNFAREAEVAMSGQRAKILNVLDWFPYMAGKSKDKLAGMYSSIDTAWKYATYISGLRKGGIRMDGSIDMAKALEFIGGRKRPNMTEKYVREQVELEVARRIHLGFPMLDRVGENVAQAGKYAGILFNPYLKIKTELLRNYAQLPQRILNEDGMSGQLMMYGLIAATMAGLWTRLREENGISQKEVDNAFANAPPAFKRFKPGAAALWFRQADGQLLALDMTQLFEPLTWLPTDPSASMSTEFLTDAALMAFDGTPIEGAGAGLLAQGGYLSPEAKDRLVPEWQRGGARMWGEILSRLGPGVARNTYNTLAKNPQMGVFAPPGGRMPAAPGASPAVGAANLILGPNRLQPLGSPEQANKNVMGLRMELEQARRELRAMMRMTEGQSTGTFSPGLNKAEAESKAAQVLQQKIAALEAQLAANGGIR